MGAQVVPSSRGKSGTTYREVLDLPVLLSLDASNRVLDISRSKGYPMAKTGTYPVTVLRIGGTYRVRRADLLRYLGIADDATAQDAA